MDLTPFKGKNSASVVRNVVVFTSKSGATFSDAMDVFFEPETYINPETMNLKVNKAIGASHAFDKGNERALNWIQDEREGIAEQVAARYRERYGYGYGAQTKRLSPLHSIDSKASFLVQAADIAAGLARHLYEVGSILEVTIHFDYGTFNGRRFIGDDAYELVREWRQKGYL
ncbi:MAG TPA: DUF3800 domain-containing protein [Blastocatellia bacterium]|nr:DUF3800 domain-containing protein [Blastocatellia bacterium]